jgi:hypothetical protein
LFAAEQPGNFFQPFPAFERRDVGVGGPFSVAFKHFEVLMSLGRNLGGG